MNVQHEAPVAATVLEGIFAPVLPSRLKRVEVTEAATETSTAAASGPGATRDEWLHFANTLGLESDLLPVVANAAATPAPLSAITDFSKTPSMYNRERQAHGVSKWPLHVATASDIARWSSEPDYAVCTIGRELKALDVDVASPTLSAEIRAFVDQLAGALPCRMRPNSGKLLLAFRLPGAFAKRKFGVRGGGEKDVVEFLGDRQQFLLAGQHKSGVRYTWDGGLPAQIPELSADEFEMLWSALVAQFAKPGTTSTGRAPDLQTKPRRASDADGDDVAYILEHWTVRGEEPDGRLHVLCPNADQHNPDQDAISSTTYTPAGVGRAAPGFRCLHAHCDDITASVFLRHIGFDDPINDFEVITPSAEQEAESAIVRARNAKRSSGVLETEAERSARIGRQGAHAPPTQRVMSGTEMLEELVYIAEGSRVSFVVEPRYALPFNEFKSLTAGSVDKVQGKGKLHRAQRWLESPDRKTVRTQTFAPGQPAMCLSPEDVLAQNLWLPRCDAPPADWRELVRPFFDHVAYLVPSVDERERFLDWLAHIEQAPGVLPSTHYLLVAKQTGIGRNWLAYALARAFAGHTALGFDLGEALRSGFNGALSQKLLAVVDELHEGGPGGMGKPIAEKLKSMLTEATRRVNPKFGRQHVEFNCCRFLMFSNHESALPLAENDRRVVVLENPSARRDADYYRRLYALLEAPGLGAALAAAFRERDISAFNPGEVAPMSAAKARTIRAGRSEVEQAVRDVASEWPSACITSARLQHAVSEALGGGKSWSVQGACVAAGLVKYAGRVKVAGIPSHVWLLRDQRRWAGVAPAEIAAEVLRGEAATNGSEFE